MILLEINMICEFPMIKNHVIRVRGNCVSVEGEIDADNGIINEFREPERD